MKTFYVYGHFIPNSETPFYIGKGTGRRYKKTDNRNKWWRNIVQKHGYESKILHENLQESEACELEKQLIAQYGRRDLGTGVLVNLTDGGESSKGAILTEEQRIARSKQSTKMWASKTDEERHAIGLKRWENMADEIKEQHRQKVGLSSKGRKHSEESRQRNREAQLKRWESLPEEVKEQWRDAGRKNSLKRWNRNRA